MIPGISIIICCYNSDWIISRTLEGIKNQVIPADLQWEVILVDNNCTDNTAIMAQNVMHDSNIDFSILLESNPGLANARRRGIDAAKYTITLYCDDDNILCPEYVATLYDIMQSDSTVGAAGGKGIAEYTREPESEALNNPISYAVGSQMDGRKDWLFGAGLVLRTELVREIYHNQRMYLMGRKGSQLLSGDDSELVMSVCNRGYHIHPTDEVYYIHVLKESRLTNEYYARLYEGLILPTKVFDTMRAAMYNKGFQSIMNGYWYWIKRYIKYSLMLWRSTSESKRKRAQLELHLYNYWGMMTLFRIYQQWKRIHDANN